MLQTKSIKSNISQKNKLKEESAEKILSTNALEKVKELEAKLAHLTRLLSYGRRHAGLELQLVTTKKRLAKAREMCKINNLISVKSAHPENQNENKEAAAAKNISKRMYPTKSLSQEYGNYYSMRCNILHMEVNKQLMIEKKGLQGFLKEYQDKLAKCFLFEQSQTVQDLFATNRINKLSEKKIENPKGPKDPKTLKAIVSESSMSEVRMEKDLVTLISSSSSCSSLLSNCPGVTNFVSQFLNDKVLEVLQAAANPDEYPNSVQPLNIRNGAGSVSDSRLANLMTKQTRINRSAESVKVDFQNMKLSSFRGKGSVIIPIKNARAMTDIKMQKR